MLDGTDAIAIGDSPYLLNHKNGFFFSDTSPPQIKYKYLNYIPICKQGPGFLHDQFMEFATATALARFESGIPFSYKDQVVKDSIIRLINEQFFTDGHHYFNILSKSKSALDIEDSFDSFHIKGQGPSSMTNERLKKFSELKKRLLERPSARLLQQSVRTTASIEALRNDYTEFKTKMEFNINVLGAHHEAMSNRFDVFGDETPQIKEQGPSSKTNERLETTRY